MSDVQSWTILIGLLTAGATTFGFIWRLTTQTIAAQFGQMHERFEGVNAQFDAIRHDLEGIDYRFEAVDAQFDRVNAQFDRVNAQFDRVNARFEAVNARFDAVDQKFVAFDHQLDRVEGVLGGKLDDLGRRTSLLEDDVRALTRPPYNGPRSV